MKGRTIEEIIEVFREFGLTEKTWGKMPVPAVEPENKPELTEQIFIRTETTTTPLEGKTNANMA